MDHRDRTAGRVVGAHFQDERPRLIMADDNILRVRASGQGGDQAEGIEINEGNSVVSGEGHDRATGA
jgi:hypothetical protein